MNAPLASPTPQRPQKAERVFVLLAGGFLALMTFVVLFTWVMRQRQAEIETIARPSAVEEKADESNRSLAVNAIVGTLKGAELRLVSLDEEKHDDADMLRVGTLDGTQKGVYSPREKERGTGSYIKLEKNRFLPVK